MLVSKKKGLAFQMSEERTNQQLTKDLSTLDPTTAIEGPALGCFK